MPRARINVLEDEQVVKKPRAPRKPRVISDEDSLAVKTRKQAPSRDINRIDEDPEPIRKAPTAIAQTKRVQRRSKKMFFIICGFCTLLTGSGIFLGVSDKGEINVVAVVNNRNEKINRGEVRDEKTGEITTQSVPVQANDPRPNGGLGGGVPEAPIPTPTPQVMVASTTPLVTTSSSSNASSSTTTVSNKAKTN